MNPWAGRRDQRPWDATPPCARLAYISAEPFFKCILTQMTFFESAVDGLLMRGLSRLRS
jgi:hypothetical protein